MDTIDLKGVVSIIGGVFTTISAWICYLVARFLVGLVTGPLGLTAEDRTVMAFLAALACVVVCAIEPRDARARIS
jgi:hypothetical protein